MKFLKWRPKSSLLDPERYLKLPLDRTALFGIALILGLFFLLRIPPSDGRIIVSDEWIPIRVSEAMATRSDLDPNWRLSKVPQGFRYDQYNFYGYIVLGHGFIQLGKALGSDPLITLRAMNLLLQLVAAFGIFMAVYRVSHSKIAGFFGAGSFTLAPMVVQDAAIARPESLLYAIAAMIVWAGVSDLRRRQKTLIIVGLATAGVTVKFTFAVVAVPFLAVTLILQRARSAAGVLLDFLACAMVSLLMLFVIAPYAVLKPQVTWNGIQYLLTQYAGRHVPHSLPEHTYLGQLLWISEYFLSFFFLLFIVSFVGFLYGNQSYKRIIVICSLPFFILVFYFASKSVFFERNFAHVLPGLIVASSVAFAALAGRVSQWRRLVIGVVTLAQLAIWATPVAMMTMQERRKSLDGFVERVGLEGYVYLDRSVTLGRSIPEGCGRYAAERFNDAYTAQFVNLMRESGFVQKAHYRSPFSRLPMSTLHVYLASDWIFLEKTCN